MASKQEKYAPAILRSFDLSFTIHSSQSQSRDTIPLTSFFRRFTFSMNFLPVVDFFYLYIFPITVTAQVLSNCYQIKFFDARLPRQCCQVPNLFSGRYIKKVRPIFSQKRKTQRSAQRVNFWK